MYESKRPIKTLTGQYRHQHRSPSSAEAGTNEPPYRSSRKSNTFTLSPHTCRKVPTCHVHRVCPAALWKTLPTLLLPPFYVFSSVQTGFSTVRGVIPINPEVTKLPKRLASRASRGSAHGLTCRLWNVSTFNPRCPTMWTKSHILHNTWKSFFISTFYFLFVLRLFLIFIRRLQNKSAGHVARNRCSVRWCIVKFPRNTGNQDGRFLPMPETLADHVVASSSVWRTSCFIMWETDIKQLHGEIVLTDTLRVCVDEILEKVWVSSKSLLNAVGQEICHQAAVN